MNTRKSTQKQTIESKSNLTTGSLIKHVMISANLQREEELRIKQSYLNHLKSIDISKFSYPNE